MNIIQALQITSALYVLTLIGVGVVLFLSYVITGNHVGSRNLTGWPAVVAIVATTVCAVTTLIEVA